MVMRESVVYIPEHVLERSWEMEIVTEAMTTTVVITPIAIAVIHGQNLILKLCSTTYAVVNENARCPM